MQTTYELRDNLIRTLLTVEDVQTLRQIQEYLRQFQPGRQTVPEISPQAAPGANNETAITTEPKWARAVVRRPKTTRSVRDIIRAQGKENMKFNIQDHFERLRELGDDGDPTLEEMLNHLKASK